MKPLMHSGTKLAVNRFLKSPAHALALHGEQGSGKGYLAQFIAAKLLDVATVDQHPYVFHLNASVTKVGIEEVRTIQAFLKLKVPGEQLIKRVVLLESIDEYGHEAQNALLKTLEEPPADTVIIVTITKRQSILQTIHSRVQSIQVLAVDIDSALTFYSNRYSQQQITKAHYISGGLPGLLNALLLDSAEHPLVLAINQARLITSMTRYQRLTKVDALLKDKQIAPSLLLDGLHRLIEAGYKQSLLTKDNKQLQIISKRLTLIDKALTDLQQNVQAKLVLSRLFLEF